MLRSFVGIVALTLLTGGTAAAQTAPQTDIAVSYQFATTSSTSTVANVPPVTSLRRGFDVALAGRVHPLVSIVGRFGMNFAPTVTVPTSGISGSSEFGTVSYHVSDWAGGVKLGHAGTSAFFQVLAGVRHSHTGYENVSSHGRTQFYYDDASGSHFLFEPGVGVDIRSKSSRVGLHLEAGVDFIFDVPIRSNTFDVQPGNVQHFRLATGVVIALGGR